MIADRPRARSQLSCTILRGRTAATAAGRGQAADVADGGSLLSQALDLLMRVIDGRGTLDRVTWREADWAYRTLGRP